MLDLKKDIEELKRLEEETRTSIKVMPVHKMPSMTAMARNFARTMKEVAVQAVKNPNEAVNVPQHIYEQRMTICMQCEEYFDKRTNRCAACGCKMTWKATLAGAHCGLRDIGLIPKWGPVKV